MSRPRWFLAAAIGASLLLSLAAVEILLRQLNVGHLSMAIENPHGTGSFRLAPGYSYQGRYRDFSLTVSINRHGMRWRDVAVEKPAGKRRIAFVGDSFTWGAWSESGESACGGTVERLLDRTKVEVLNFGVGGYGVDDYELILKEEVARFAPDYVVVALFMGNDFRDTFLGLDKYRLVDGAAEFKDFSAKLPNTPKASVIQRAVSWVKATRTYTLLRPFAFRFRAANVSHRFAPSSDLFSFTYWSRTPLPPDGQQAVADTLGRLDGIRRECDRIGARLVLLALPFEEQVVADHRSGPGYSIEYPQRYVEEFASRQGIPYLSLLEPLRHEYKRRAAARYYLPFDPHFNSEGHRLVGSIVAEFVRNNVLAQ